MLIIIAANYFVLPVLSLTVLFISKKKKRRKNGKIKSPELGRGKGVPSHTEHLHNVLTHYGPNPGFLTLLGK